MEVGEGEGEKWEDKGIATSHLPCWKRFCLGEICLQYVERHGHLLQALAQLVKRADVLFRQSALAEEALRLRHDCGDAFDNFVAPISLSCRGVVGGRDQELADGALGVACGTSSGNFPSLFFKHESQVTTICHTANYISMQRVLLLYRTTAVSFTRQIARLHVMSRLPSPNRDQISRAIKPSSLLYMS